jgi:GGDEF domain-containing protein
MDRLEETDQLSDTIKTRLMAHAEDLAFEGYRSDPYLTPEEFRFERAERMFRAATAIAKIFELQPLLPTLQVVKAVNLSDPETLSMVRERFIEPIIFRHYRNEAERIGSRDHNTGLPDMSAFSRALKTSIELNCWFIAIDFDNFKAINDSLGHPGGNAALREFAVIMTETVGEFGKVARSFRTGGDEFSIIVGGPQPKLTAARIINHLKDLLEQRLASDLPFIDPEGNQFPAQKYQELHMGFTAGIGITPELADDALLRGKSNVIKLPEPRRSIRPRPTDH